MIAAPVDPRLVEAACVERARRSLHYFVREAWHVLEPDSAFVDGWHIRALCAHLQRVSRGEILRLVINISPRSSKSTVVSIAWPAWTWATNPGVQWMCLSHSDRLAVDHSRKMRMLVQSGWYQNRWPLPFSTDQNAKTRFDNDCGGYRLASTLKAGVTGLGATNIILDDPHDADEARSDVEREAGIIAYREKISTRLNDPATGAIVAIGQRLHESDLFGYLVKAGFQVLCIPMRYESAHLVKTTTGWRDPRTREGELMCPERFTEEYVRGEELVLGAQAVAGQFQQRPAPAEGAMFKQAMFRYYSAERHVVDGAEVDVLVLTQPDGSERKVLARDCYWFQTCDTAMETGEDAAYTCVGTFSVTPKPHCLLIHDMNRAKITVPAQYGFVRAQKARWPRVRFQAVEKAASGIGLLQEARSEGSPFIVLKADRSKELRAEPVAIQYEQGLVYHLAGAPWLPAFEGEMLVFPNGQYKDQCDVTAYAGIIMQSRKWAGRQASGGMTVWPSRAGNGEKEQDEGESADRPMTLAEKLTGRRPTARATAFKEWLDRE